MPSFLNTLHVLPTLFSLFFHKSGQMHWVFIYTFEVYRFLVTRVNNTTLTSSLPGKESVNQNLTSQWEPTSVSPAPTKDLCQNGEWKFQNLKMQQQQMLPWNSHDFWNNSAEVTPVLTALVFFFFFFYWSGLNWLFILNRMYCTFKAYKYVWMGSKPIKIKIQ